MRLLPCPRWIAGWNRRHPRLRFWVMVSIIAQGVIWVAYLNKHYLWSGEWEGWVLVPQVAVGLLLLFMAHKIGNR